LKKNRFGNLGTKLAILADASTAFQKAWAHALLPLVSVPFLGDCIDD
jgi:hypothetical protein